MGLCWKTSTPGRYETLDHIVGFAVVMYINTKRHRISFILYADFLAKIVIKECIRQLSLGNLSSQITSFSVDTYYIACTSGNTPC